ncbi:MULTISPECIES: hypothetical protein [unclassified Streptomyces]|uniref:hypothetical protein n=1 Tax=unclassified Streptomyces TaxID=2593676 RepID=UPI0003723FD6|nr:MULTISPECIES: hypothetical protein [unclassified Streptomyces]MYT27378.1 hypothetical protein [Streptomyces sp. SID8354]
MGKEYSDAYVDSEALTHLLGQLSIGELMPYAKIGWALMRSGTRLSSEREGATRSPWLRPSRVSFMDALGP